MDVPLCFSKALWGHIGRHSSDYHREIRRRLDEAWDGLDKKTKENAAAAVDEVLKDIWKDIMSGDLAPYRGKDVIL